MSKTSIRFLDVIYWIAIIGADIIVYLALGLVLMDYDDNWDASKGAYWSLQSMNNRQLLFYFAFQLWKILNVIALILIVRKVYKFIMNRKA